MQLAYSLKFPKSSAMFATKYFTSKKGESIPNLRFTNENHKIYAARSVTNQRVE